MTSVSRTGLGLAALGRPDVAADPALAVASTRGHRYVGARRVDAEVHEVEDRSLSAFRERLGESRAALLGGHLAVHQVHSVTPGSPVLHDDELLHALAAALAQPWASRVLSGAVTPEQARSDVRAADVVVTAGTSGTLAPLAPLAQEPATSWRERSQRAWR